MYPYEQASCECGLLVVLILLLICLLASVPFCNSQGHRVHRRAEPKTGERNEDLTSEKGTADRPGKPSLVVWDLKKRFW